MAKKDAAEMQAGGTRPGYLYSPQLQRLFGIKPPPVEIPQDGDKVPTDVDLQRQVDPQLLEQVRNMPAPRDTSMHSSPEELARRAAANRAYEEERQRMAMQQELQDSMAAQQQGRELSPMDASRFQYLQQLLKR